MNDRPDSDAFDERFLSAYGLGDPDNPLKSNSSVNITNNRESKLEKQAKESPWSVEMLTTGTVKSTISHAGTDLLIMN